MQAFEELIRKLLQSRVASNLVGLFAIAFIGHTLWQAWSTFQEMPSTGPATPGQAVSAEPDRSQTEPLALANQLSELHLFGKVQTQTSRPEPVPKDAPDTKLKLTLHGLYVEQPEGLAYAIIQHQSKEQKHFTTGESVFGLAVLHAIYPDRVILDRKGQFETLRLPQERTNIALVTDTPAGNQQKADSSRVRLSHFEYHIELSSEESDDESDSDALAGFSVEPATDTGRAWLEQLNMAPGDVIVEVNGARLDREEKVEILEQALEGDGPVAVTIDRNGTVFSAILVAPRPTGAE